MGTETNIKRKALILSCPYCKNWIAHDRYVDHLIFHHNYPDDSTPESVIGRITAIGGYQTKEINKEDLKDYQ